MQKVRNLNELLKDAVKKQTKARDIQTKVIKKQDKTENELQIKPTLRKLDEG